MTTPSQTDLRTVFSKKYSEFAEDLRGALPELAAQISAALALSSEVRLSQFRETVLPTCTPTRDPNACPGTVLPGVTITTELWEALSQGSRQAIQQHLTVLSFCMLYDGAKEGFGSTPELADEFLKQLREKMSSVDFEGMSKKLTDMFKGMSPDKLPKLPERFMKGHLAKLAEELVREFKPEDFGLSAEELSTFDSDPMKAFTLLTDVYTKKPEILQKAIQRIASRLQEKVRRGELRPDQIAAEAEELIKEFSGNSSFVELMESFRSTFGMEDPDLAREAGRDDKARLSLVKDRLRKKLEARKGGKK
jgi:hypothetical protein